jgi:transcriptional regulator with XRE-family HTH domain
MNQHHNATNRVLNQHMATIGDRIRRARLARNMTGEELATAVGYKNQSAIGNLENRAGGTGGQKLPDIARALRVPLTWLAEGPDDGDIPFLEPLSTSSTVRHTTLASEPASAPYTVDASVDEAVTLFTRLRTEQRLKAISYMHELLSRAGPGTNQIGVGESDSVPHDKAA